ncbi:regulation of nuclear pre-mRNA domain-containing protein 1A [Anabrus simplex]|uniref:regulation of nuclear pre-mRNA domain-containing protein 1A n=1 Tax=Anabrus simplex TaxID=316456 RepID=UPI0034DD0C98
MAGFTESAFLKKLANLYSSQQSIQTLSLWLIHHKKHYATIVKVWFRELLKVKESQKLTFMYLANDVIQNSNKKGPEMRKEFAGVLPKAFSSIAIPECDEQTRKSLERILSIWEQRGVYDARLIRECRKGLEIPGKEGAPPVKKQKVEPVVDKKVVAPRAKTPIRQHKLSETEVEVDGKKERHTTLSPRTPAQDAPEPEELIKALLDLENSASSDAAVREKIAGLPPEVSEVNLLSKLEDRASAEKLAVQVNEAVDLLTEYNGRLSLEMEDRKKVSAMLHDFIQAQKDLLAYAEQRLEEYTEKLNKVAAICGAVRSSSEES